MRSSSWQCCSARAARSSCPFGGEPAPRNVSQAKNPFDRFARLYDWEHDQYRADVDVHVGFARRFGGPVLELACGTGRLLGPLAQAGFACTGVDSSSAMLERARVRLERLSGAQPTTLVEQRLEALALDGRFRTIILGL